MIFTKTSATTVQCDITNIELEQLGILARDVVDGTENARDFLYQLNQEVGRQLEYNPKEDVIMYSRNLLVNGNLRIIAMKLTNEDIREAASRMRKAAEGIQASVSEKIVDHILSKTGVAKAEALNDMIQQVSMYMNSVSGEEVPSQNAVQPVGDNEKPTIVEHCSYIASFDHLDKVMQFCEMIQDYPVQDAKLYKEKDIYYLFFDIDVTDEGMLYEIQAIGIEYADEIQIDPSKRSHIEETGECIVRKNAVKSLGEIGKEPPAPQK
ncbi:MAG: adaptor protein MecA [Lachnospiraceae bacterium]|nr:adaptor protein MecA [Lachnospiraceae bacterium]